jgi:hypothetical protein
MDSENAIKREYMKGDLSYINAIGRLENLGLKPTEAENLVEEWQSECEGGEDDC